MVITAEGIRKIASICSKDGFIDPEEELQHPYWYGLSICKNNSDKESILESILRGIDRGAKMAAAEGYGSLFFQIDYDIKNGEKDDVFYKKNIAAAYLALLNGRYDVNIEEEVVERNELLDCDSYFNDDYYRNHRTINLLIEW